MSSDQKDRRSAVALSLGSSLAAMIAKLATHPIDTIKAKLQISRIQMRTLSDVNKGSAIQIIKRTYKNEGLPGFFRGVTISALGSTIAFSCYMSTYEYSKKKLSEIEFFKGRTTLAHLVCGFIAEIVSCSLWLPIDVIKQRMQVQSELNIYKYKGPLDAAKKINLSEGAVGLYRAYGATLLFFGPFSAIFFATYEKMKDLVLVDRQKPKLLESIICSATASGFAGYIVTPLEIVKLRMQIQRADVATHGGSLEKSVFGYRNTFHGLYRMIIDEGAFALYKGGLMRICFTIPITTISMSLTEVFKQTILESGALQKWI